MVNVMTDIPTLGAITVDLPPGYSVKRNPQMFGVLYFDEQGRQIASQPGDNDPVRRHIWILYNRRTDKPEQRPQLDVSDNARELAEVHGINLDTITPARADGKITLRDIKQAINDRAIE